MHRWIVARTTIGPPTRRLNPLLCSHDHISDIFQVILLATVALDLPEIFCQAFEYGGRREDGDDDDGDDYPDPSSRVRSAVTSTNARPLKNIRSSQKNKNN